MRASHAVVLSGVSDGTEQQVCSRTSLVCVSVDVSTSLDHDHHKPHRTCRTKMPGE